MTREVSEKAGTLLKASPPTGADPQHRANG